MNSSRNKYIIYEFHRNLSTSAYYYLTKGDEIGFVLIICLTELFIFPRKICQDESVKVITGANAQAILEPKLWNLHLNKRNRKVPFSKQTIEVKLLSFREFDSYLCESEGKERKKEERVYRQRAVVSQNYQSLQIRNLRQVLWLSHNIKRTTQI